MPREQASQSGNVFFAMFGAVGLIGILGASMMTIMKGPVRGMQRVTKYTVAENNMIAAGRLALVAAAQQDGGGDCDGDGYVEPVPFGDTGTGSAPGGGGYLPSTIGATSQDPWGNTYGYCAWDHGDEIDNAGCGGAGQNRLSGSTDETNIALAIVSSGPDKVFQTTCADDDTYITRPSGSDDIILQYTYAESKTLAGGLWNEKAGEPTIAEIGKDLEVKDSGGDVIFGVDSATDPTKPSIKADFISKLTPANWGVSFLSHVLLEGNAPRLRLRDDDNASSYFEIIDSSAAQTALRKVTASGGNILEIGALPSDATSSATVRLFRETNTSGAVSLQIMRGDATATVDHLLRSGASGKSYLAANGGFVGIGTNNPQSAVDVNGQVRLSSLRSYGFTTGSNAIQVQASGSSEQWINFRWGGSPASAAGVIFSYYDTGHFFVENGSGGNKLLFHYSSENSSAPTVTAATPIMALTSAGELGVGTDDPSAKLDIVPSSGVALELGRVTGNPNVKSSDGYLIMDSNGSNAALNWYVADDVILANGGGNVGIGTTGPTHSLTVGGTVRVDQGASYDLWLQGGSTTSGGNARNLAFLGNKSQDKLYVNYGSEYTGGTTIGGPVTLSGDVTVSGTYTGAGDNLGSGGTTSGTVYSNNGTYGYFGLDSGNYFRFANSYMLTRLGANWVYRTYPTYFAPYSTGSADLGHTSYRWSNLYVNGVNVAGDVVPSGTTRNLGSLGSPWNELQVKTISASSGIELSSGWVQAPQAIINGNIEAATYYSNDTYGYFGNSSSDYMRVSSGNVYWRNGGAWAYQMTGTHFLPYSNELASLGTSGKRWNQIRGKTVYADTVVDTSDRRRKKEIQTIEEPFDLLDGIHGSRFVWKENGKSAYGVIAQDVQKAMPEAVVEDTDDDKTLMVNYHQIIAPLIEAAKQLKAETDALREQDALQAAAIAKLISENHMLRRQIAGVDLPANDNEETEVPKRANQSRR